jgi:hypothetical protein
MMTHQTPPLSHSPPLRGREGFLCEPDRLRPSPATAGEGREGGLFGSILQRLCRSP